MGNPRASVSIERFSVSGLNQVRTVTALKVLRDFDGKLFTVHPSEELPKKI